MSLLAAYSEGAELLPVPAPAASAGATPTESKGTGMGMGMGGKSAGKKGSKKKK